MARYFLAVLDPAGNEIRRTNLRVDLDHLLESDFTAGLKGKELYRDALCREGLFQQYREKANLDG